MQRRLVSDWQTRFGHPVLLLETNVYSSRFHGGVYRAANWTEPGGQVFLIEREVVNKKSGHHSFETAVGLTRENKFIVPPGARFKTDKSSPVSMEGRAKKGGKADNKHFYQVCVFSKEMMKQIFTVTGMTCEHCEKTVVRAVRQLDRAAAVQADRTTNRVEVESDQPRDALAQAIAEEGFTVAN